MHADTVYMRGGVTGFAPLPMPSFEPPPPTIVSAARLFPSRRGYSSHAPTLIEIFRMGR